MKPIYDHAGVQLYHGDAVEVLGSLPAESVERCVTDPPYDLTAGKNGGTGLASLNENSPAGRARISTGFMGKPWDGTGVAFESATWQAVLRILKPGGHLLSFGGTRTSHRLVCAIEDAGFEIRDSVVWHHGSGFPKSLDIGKAIGRAAGAEREVTDTIPDRWAGKGDVLCRANQSEVGSVDITAPATEAAKQWDGHGTALKPSHEPICVAMKPLDGTFAANAQKHGVAGLNIDAGRIAHDEECKPMKPQPGGNKVCGQAGRYEETTELKANGRWPANTIFSHHPDCNGQCVEGCPVAELDRQSGERRSGGVTHQPKRTGYSGFDSSRDNGTHVQRPPDTGGASRFFYTAKASRSERGEGNNHPTVKPLAIMDYLLKLTATPTGGTVLDPFAGSGTTGLAAYNLGVPCILIEQSEEYCDIIVKRLEAARQLQPLFA